MWHALIVLTSLLLAGGPTQAPVMEVSPSRLSFLGDARGATLGSQRVSIRNAGGGSVSWRAVPSHTWIRLSALQGTAPASLVISIDPRNVPAGEHRGHVTIDAGPISGSPATIEVRVSISAAAQRPPSEGEPSASPSPALAATPDQVAFAAPAGQADPLTYKVRISTPAGRPLRWTATSSQRWLRVSPEAGSTPLDVVLTAMPANLAIGDHDATVTFRGTQPREQLVLPVRLSLHTPSGPLAFASNGLPVAAVNMPYSQVIPVRGGRPPYTFQLVRGPLPADLGLSNGAISGVPRMPGSYAFTIGVTDSATPPSTALQTLVLTVAVVDQRTALAVRPGQVRLDVVAGGMSAPVTLAVLSGGPPLTWQVTADARWLILQPATGMAPGTLALHADGTGLAPGLYRAALTVRMDGTPNSPLTVPVELVVRK